MPEPCRINRPTAFSSSWSGESVVGIAKPSPMSAAMLTSLLRNGTCLSINANTNSDDCDRRGVEEHLVQGIGVGRRDGGGHLRRQRVQRIG